MKTQEFDHKAILNLISLLEKRKNFLEVPIASSIYDKNNNLMCVSQNLKEKLNNLGIDQEEFLKLYNKIIDGIYLGLLEQSNNIIEEAENHIFGIIYDKNILVPRLNEKGEKNFKFYWSNKGQRACDKDHRLSIRFRPLKETIVGYQYDTKTHSNQLKLVELNLDLRDDEGNFKKDITCPIT